MQPRCPCHLITRQGLPAILPTPPWALPLFPPPPPERIPSCILPIQSRETCRRQGAALLLEPIAQASQQPCNRACAPTVSPASRLLLASRHAVKQIAAAREALASASRPRTLAGAPLYHQEPPRPRVPRVPPPDVSGPAPRRRPCMPSTPRLDVAAAARDRRSARRRSQLPTGARCRSAASVGCRTTTMTVGTGLATYAPTGPRLMRDRTCPRLLGRHTRTRTHSSGFYVCWADTPPKKLA